MDCLHWLYGHAVRAHERNGTAMTSYVLTIRHDDPDLNISLTLAPADLVPQWYDLPGMPSRLHASTGSVVPHNPDTKHQQTTANTGCSRSYDELLSSENSQ